MVDTVIILNEELCSMSLAFEKAGYKILVAYESDKKACDVYKKNMKSNIVCDDITKIDTYSLPDADMIAGKLEIHNNNNLKRDAKDNVLMKMELLHTFLEAVKQKTPKTILFEVNANAVNTKLFHYFIYNSVHMYNRYFDWLLWVILVFIRKRLLYHCIYYKTCIARKTYDF